MNHPIPPFILIACLGIATGCATCVYTQASPMSMIYIIGGLSFVGAADCGTYGTAGGF